ncbi:MAG: ASKHA domain-containing protein [Terracidiphilus sp.]|nr:ASKHA domain-containing protein [Terracidiphilus sp.]MDR3797155.1 ASKHA domain-containing protein [Terracidiphilus sp.]
MTCDLVRIRLEPLSVELKLPLGSSLIAALAAHGVEFPCGGMGECSGCQVRVLSGSLLVTEADSATLTPDQLAKGWRLACQARAHESLVLECGQWRMQILADDNPSDPIPKVGALATMVAPSIPAVISRERAGDQSASSSRGLAVAIDLGTTTIAAQLIDASGNVLAVETALNPQAAFGSDVMSRIRAALEGQDLTTPIRVALGQIVARLARGRASQVAEVLLVGNTVMHHLFGSLDVEPLAHVPFQSPNLAEQRFTPRDLGWDLPSDCVVRFARCIGGFIGSDILAGIVAAGIALGDDLTALVDLGTNGEIAIGNRHGIVCASTAAGPAFEAGSIRMGMRAVTGAIAYVALVDGTLRPTVLGDGAPRGICGSGLVDAVAAGLRSGSILANGRIADGSKNFPIALPVVLYQSDIRELQLAKGAIAAGFRLLLKRLGAQVSSLHAIHLAGAFGNYVQIESALRIGLLEAPHSVIHAAGNTALRGAKMLLLAREEPQLPPIEHVSLAADPAFQDEFAACMTFPENL